MVKLILSVLIAMGVSSAFAGPYYDLGMHTSSATLKVSGDIKVAASTPSHTNPVITLTGATGAVSAARYQISGSTVLASVASDSSLLLGKYAGVNMTAAFNTAVGINALNLATTGEGNTAIGAETSGWYTTQRYNTAVGFQALYYPNAGEFNTAVGAGAGYGTLGSPLPSFSSATLVGYLAGSGLTTGGRNTFVGHQTGVNVTTGENNILIGAGVLAPAASSSNYIDVGGMFRSDVAASSASIQGALTVGGYGIFKTSANTISQLTIQNAYDTPAALYGTAIALQDGTGHTAILGLTGHQTTFMGGVFSDTFQNWQDGYGDTLYAIGGNKYHRWYADPTDTHDYLVTMGNEIMNLSPTSLLTVSSISTRGSITGASFYGNGGTLTGVVPSTATGYYGISVASAAWAPSSEVSGLTFMGDGASPDISGYGALVSIDNYVPATRSTVTVASPIVVNTYISSMATNVGYPGVTLIPAGVWHVHVHLKATNSNRLKLTCEIYTRTAGGVEADLSASEESAFISTSEAEYDFYGIMPSTAILSTTRIVGKLKATTISGAVGVDVYMLGTGKNETGSRLELPATSLSVNSYVPYTGATKSVTLGSYGLTASSVTVSSTVCLGSDCRSSWPTGSGSGSGASWVEQNFYANTNGSQTNFTLTQTPLPNSLRLSKNGVVQAPGAAYDYTLSGVTITMNTAPASSTTLVANYAVADSSFNILSTTNTWTATQTISSATLNAVVMPTRDKITFGNQLLNSSSTVINGGASYNFVNTGVVGNTCVTGSTLTLTMNGGRPEISFSGTVYNSTAGKLVCLGVKINGATVGKSSKLCVQMGPSGGAYWANGSFTYMPDSTYTGTTTFCLDAFVDANTGTIYQDVGQEARFYVKELR